MSSFSKLVLLYFAGLDIKFASTQQAAQMEGVLSSCTCRTATASVVEVAGDLFYKM